MTGGILVELKWMGFYLSQSFWVETFGIMWPSRIALCIRSTLSLYILVDDFSFWHCVKYRKQNICIQVQVLVVTNVGKIEAIIGRRTLVATTQR